MAVVLCIMFRLRCMRRRDVKGVLCAYRKVCQGHKVEYEKAEPTGGEEDPVCEPVHTSTHID